MSFLRSCVKLKSNSSNFKFCNWGPITIRHNLFFSLKKHSTLVSTLYCSLYRFFFTLVLYLYVVSAPNITPYWHPLMCVLQYMKPLLKNIQWFLIYLFWNSTCMLIQTQFLNFVIVTFIFILFLYWLALILNIKEIISKNDPFKGEIKVSWAYKSWYSSIVSHLLWSPPRVELANTNSSANIS